jgi:hypothetical protein
MSLMVFMDDATRFITDLEMLVDKEQKHKQGFYE